MSAAATAAFGGVGAGRSGGFIGAAGTLNGNGKALENAVELVCAASGADDTAAVFFCNGASNLKALSA